MSLPDMLLQVAARGAALLLLTAVAGLLFRRASASTRHLIWTGGLAASLVVPLIPASDPALPVLPTIASPVPTADRVVSSASVGEPTGAPEAWAGLVAERDPVPSALGPSDRPLAPESGTDWPRFIALAWVIGLTIAGSRLVVGWIAVGRLARLAVPVVSPEWRESVGAVLVAQPLHRSLRVLESAEVRTPCTWGILRPTVLLPAEGAGWTAEERRQVVVHELAHVRRLDCATQLITGLATALHWFNPLAWYALRSARVAREQACDDAVLAAGGTASAYAGLLLAAAAPEHGPWLPAPALAMARRSQIGDRLLALLDPSRRREPVDRRAVGWISAAALAVAIPVAGVGPRQAAPVTVPAPAEQPTETSPTPAVARPMPAAASKRLQVARTGTTGLSICDSKGANRSRSSGSSASVNDDDGRITTFMVTWTGPNCSVAIHGRGKVAFTDAEDDVASLSEGGRFEAQHEDGSISRSYLVTNRNGRLERRYRVNDEDATLDAEALKWRAAVILEFIRRSGYDAKARVQRIRKRGGIDALVKEIDAINSDGVRSIYLKAALVAPETTAADATRLLGLSRAIDSDGDRASVLGATPAALLSDKGVQKAYAEGAKGIDSDGDLSSVLIRALKSGRLSSGACEWVLGLVADIDSDGDRSNVLVTATEALEWNSSCVRRALELTREISSDGDKSMTLTRFLKRHGLPAELIPVFFQTTATIDSDGDHSAVLHRVIDLKAPGDAAIEGVLEDSRRISSDGDRASVLMAAARRGLVHTERLRAVYRASAQEIDSSGDREAALRALDRS